MALEWLKKELRALLPQGQRWLYSMRHELARVQGMHRRERARDRLLRSELDHARANLARWQARRDVAAGLPRAELVEAAAAEVNRLATEVEALALACSRQSELTRTLTDKQSELEARFLAASEQARRPGRPELLIAQTLAELAQREQRFAQCEQQLLRRLPAPTPGRIAPVLNGASQMTGEINRSAPHDQQPAPSDTGVDAQFNPAHETQLLPTDLPSKQERAP